MIRDDKASVNLSLEVFRQANEHLRESDRKRNVLIGSYLAAVGIGVGWLLSAWLGEPGLVTLASSVSYIVLGTLLLLGLLVLHAVTVYRGWHAHYANVCKAVQWSVVHGLSLYEAACRLIEDKSNRRDFFSPRGVEFTMYLFVLFLWGVLAVTLTGLVLFRECSLPVWAVSIVVTSVLVIVVACGIWRYRRHLLLEQKRFPNGSWMIIQPAHEVKSDDNE